LKAFAGVGVWSTLTVETNLFNLPTLLRPLLFWAAQWLRVAVPAAGLVGSSTLHLSAGRCSFQSCPKYPGELFMQGRGAIACSPAGEITPS